MNLIQLSFAIVFVSTSIIPVCLPLKILLFCFGGSRSHVLFYHRLASTLVEHGQQVVIHTTIVFEDAILNINPPVGVREIRYQSNASSVASSRLAAYCKQYLQDMAWTGEHEGSILIAVAAKSSLNPINGVTNQLCKVAMHDAVTLDELRKEKFDIAISPTHYLNYCPVAISNLVNIGKIIWISAGTYIVDDAATVTRIPTVPAYIPNSQTSFTDQMPFMERVRNFLIHVGFLVISKLPNPYLAAEEAWYKAIVASKSSISNNFLNGKSLQEMTSEQVVTMFLNGEKLLDYPRPMLPGMAFLGQSERHTNGGELDEMWKTLIDQSNSLILFSMGSFVNTSLMPDNIKKMFFEAFKKFPNYNIVWLLEGRMPDGLADVQHIKVVQWMPQRALLYSGNVKLFITHGGYNSLVEAALAGVPMLALPLYNDQFGNAKRAKRLGIGLVLDKRNLTTDVITDGMGSILTDSKYTHKAMKLARIMRDKPIENEAAFIKNVETIARTSFWRPSVARRLNYFQLYCLDILCILAVFLIMIIFVLVRFFKHGIAIWYTKSR